MRPKVSMVIPCYNKVKYIGGMFDSILRQKWDDIELIMVNDGSTDGTRDVIAEYEPRFISRGYDTVIIDQENQGVCSAVRNGLMRVTGEYVCMPDCDDELNPEYVSEMAGWLWEHPEDNWVVCDCSRANFDRHVSDYEYPCATEDCAKYPYELLEGFMLLRLANSVCIGMYRKTLFDRNHVVERFCIEPRVTQEPQILVPLSLSGENPAYIKRSLYDYIKRDSSASVSEYIDYAKSLQWVGQYLQLIENSFQAHKKPTDYERVLLNIACISYRHLHLSLFPEYDEVLAAKRLIDAVSSGITEFACINVAEIEKSGVGVALRHIGDKLMNYEWDVPDISKRENGQIIAYAAFGKYAKMIQTGLLNSDIRPDTYWDIRAQENDCIDGIPVTLPDFDCLTENDTVLMLLETKPIIKTVTEQIREKSKCRIYYYNGVMSYLSEYYYGDSRSR